MRVFITSTSDELGSCQAVAVQVARELGHEPILRDAVPRLGLNPVPACAKQIALADVVLAIVGFRCGQIPSVNMGGDGLRPWSFWEVASAFEQRVPVVALLAGENFSDEREAQVEAAAVMSDLRGELARVAKVFDDENSFRALVPAVLSSVHRGAWTSGVAGALRLRRFSDPQLPPMPYPLLLPYAHPDLMAGRDDDLASLSRTLSLPVTVVGLHAASGTGKSSLLAGGLVPMLRAEGKPVAFDRHPTEPGLKTRLLADLLESDPEGKPVEAKNDREFVDLLLAVRGLAAGQIPVLVIDQFESLLKSGAEWALAELGPLLAASAQRLPGLEGPVCRWLLAYRQEYHGRVIEWLEDVLREARRSGLHGIDSLPHDLSDSSRFAEWPLLPLGTPPAGSAAPLQAASQVFLDAILKPLSHGAFRWAFADGHAERLAQAFGKARLRQPDDPLAPQLQVVLAHLLERVEEPAKHQIAEVTVPEETGELIDRALQQHLRRSLDRAFPHGLDSAARQDRTRALLVLRELADAHGRRDRGQAADLLAEALGEQGHEVLEKLSTPQTRLVLRRRQADTQVYLLAHDRLAEILVQVVDEGGWAELDIDEKLLGLRRFVALQSRLFASGDLQQATAVSARKFQGIEANREVLLWSDAHKSWWQACRERKKAERRQLLIRRTSAAMLILSVAWLAWFAADAKARYQAELEAIASGEPEIAFAALDRLTREPDHEAGPILDRLRQRENPFDVFERGLGGVAPSRRTEVLLRVAELTMPILEAAPEEPVLIAALVWALDFFARDPEHEGDALKLRNRVLAPLRQKRPPPPLPGPDDPRWADIPAGTFWMGAGPNEGRDKPDMQDELPRHQVSLSAFRLMVRELTNAEYRRLVPDHEGADDLPATGMNWYEAYTYAAWMGGRLPTESEWEYAARANCSFAYCKRDGSEAKLSEVAWWVGNSTDPTSGEPSIQPVMQLEPNPFGLWDIYGNVWEWNASWFGTYTEAPKMDPPGPTFDPSGNRATRSEAYLGPKPRVVASGRGAGTPLSSYKTMGIRVALDKTVRR